jgi:hypothetical protein
MFTGDTDALVREMAGSSYARLKAKQAIKPDSVAALGRIFDCERDVALSLLTAMAQTVGEFLNSDPCADYPKDPASRRGDASRWQELLLQTSAILDRQFNTIHNKVMDTDGIHVNEAVRKAFDRLFAHFGLATLDWSNTDVNRQILIAFLSNWQLLMRYLSDFLPPNLQWFTAIATQLYAQHPLIVEEDSRPGLFVKLEQARSKEATPEDSAALSRLMKTTRPVRPQVHTEIPPKKREALYKWAIAKPEQLRAAVQHNYLWANIRRSDRIYALERALGSEDIENQLQQLSLSWHRELASRPEQMLQLQGKTALVKNGLILAIARLNISSTVVDYDAITTELIDAMCAKSTEDLIALRNRWVNELNAAGFYPEFGVHDPEESAQMQHERTLLRFINDPHGSHAATIIANQWMDMVNGAQVSYIADIANWVPDSRKAEFTAANKAGPGVFVSMGISRALPPVGNTSATYLTDVQDPLHRLKGALRAAGMAADQLPKWCDRISKSFHSAMVDEVVAPMVATLNAANKSGQQNPKLSLRFRPSNMRRHRNGAIQTSQFNYDSHTDTLRFVTKVKIEYLNVEDPHYSPQMIIPFDLTARRQYVWTDKGFQLEKTDCSGEQLACFEALTRPDDYTKKIVEQGWLKPILGCDDECKVLASAPEMFGWKRFADDLAKTLLPQTPGGHRLELLERLRASEAEAYQGLCAAVPEVESDSHAILLVSLLFAVAKLACATRSTYPQLQRAINLVGTDGAALQQAVKDLGVIILTEIEPIKRVDQLSRWRCRFIEENPDIYEALDAQARAGVEPFYRDTSPRGLALALAGGADRALSSTHSMHLSTSGAQGASAAGAASSAAASSGDVFHLDVDELVDYESDDDEASPGRTPITPAAQTAADSVARSWRSFRRTRTDIQVAPAASAAAAGSAYSTAAAMAATAAASPTKSSTVSPLV